MSGQPKHFISIWFFIGLLLTSYGVLILGVGIYDVINPSALHVEMAYLHVQVWWGLALLVIGGVYVVKFRPGKR